MLSSAIYKCSLHCQCQECRKMFMKKGEIVSKVAERFKSSLKKYENPEKKIKAVKIRYDDKKESVKQYKKKIMWKIEHQILNVKE